jgi:hypothetical protein
VSNEEKKKNPPFFAANERGLLQRKENVYDKGGRGYNLTDIALGSPHNIYFLKCSSGVGLSLNGRGDSWL